MIFRFCIEVIADALAQFFIQLRGGDDTSVVRLSCHECAVTPSRTPSSHQEQTYMVLLKEFLKLLKCLTSSGIYTISSSMNSTIHYQDRDFKNC